MAVITPFANSYITDITNGKTETIKSGNEDFTDSGLSDTDIGEIEDNSFWGKFWQPIKDFFNMIKNFIVVIGIIALVIASVVLIAKIGKGE